jgi:hypothetical protein
MNKQSAIFFKQLFLGMVVSALCIQVNASISGTGVPNDPVIIYTAAELDAVRNNLSAHYKLGNDIDLSEYLAPGGAGYAQWGEEGWMPIGADNTMSASFRGSFDGAGYAISGLKMNRTANGILYQSLFGAIMGATIQNLGVNVASLRGYESSGGIAGIATNGANIENCYVTGTIYGYRGAGGVAGTIDDATISKCYTNCNITGSESLGGLAGTSYGSSMLNCYTTGSVTANSSVTGGLVGQIRDGYYATIIENCYTNNTVEGTIRIGGVAGYITPATEVEIKNSYALNFQVKANFIEAGRIVASNESALTYLENVYALESMLVVGDPGSNVINGTDIPVCETLKEEAYPQTWFDGAGAWTFDYTNYNVVIVGEKTNLPILSVFDKTNFLSALQTPYLNDDDCGEEPEFIPVTNITGVPTTAIIGVGLTLVGTVIPTHATHKTIEWSVKTDGGTGSIIINEVLTATDTGTVIITATITNGAAIDADYIQDFNIVVDDPNHESVDESMAQKIQIFPTPTLNEIFIKSELPIKKVEIYSIIGVLLLSEDNCKEKISVSNLPKGVYIVKIDLNDHVVIQRIVKE